MKHAASRVLHPARQPLELLCTGRLAGRSFGEGWGGGDEDSVWQFFRISVRKAYDSFDSVVGEWNKLQADYLGVTFQVNVT